MSSSQEPPSPFRLVPEEHQLPVRRTEAEPAMELPNPMDQVDASAFRLAPEKPHAGEAEKSARPDAPENFHACGRCKKEWPQSLMQMAFDAWHCLPCAATAREEHAKKKGATSDVRKLKIWMSAVAIVLIVAVSGTIFVGRDGSLSLKLATYLRIGGSIGGAIGLFTGYVWLLVRAFREHAGWGVFCLLSPAMNFGALMAFSLVGDAFKFPLLMIREPFLAAAILLVPITMTIYVIQHWETARRPFAAYALGLFSLGMAFFGGPDGRSLVCGEWIASDNSVAVRLAPDRTITSVNGGASGTYEFNSGESFTIAGLKKYSSGQYVKEKDVVILKFWDGRANEPRSAWALYEKSFVRVTDGNREQLQKVPKRVEL